MHYRHLCRSKSISANVKILPLMGQCSMQGWAVCCVYCLDCQFIAEVSKFVAGSLQALSAMVLLELPHVNVLTKVDLLTPDSKVYLEYCRLHL